MRAARRVRNAAGLAAFAGARPDWRDGATRGSTWDWRAGRSWRPRLCVGAVLGVRRLIAYRNRRSQPARPLVRGATARHPTTPIRARTPSERTG